MRSAQTEWLLAQLFDGELTTSEAEALASLLRTDSKLRRELRDSLVAWELWSQRHAPERSAESFLAGCRTRLAAESEGDRFLSEVQQRISELESSELPTGESTGVPQVQPCARWRHCRLPRLAWAAVVAAAAAALWTFTPHTAQAVTLHGEAICTACALHETHAHLPAIRVHEQGTTHIYYVRPDPSPVQQLGSYCAAPMPVVVTGTTTLREGHRLIDVHAAARDTTAPAPATAPDAQRVLFPF
jgi:hypothetical protein